MHGHVVCLVGRARDPLDYVAPVQHVCVWVSCVYDFARFVYLLQCSELYSAALSRCMRFGAPRRLNLTAEIALASPHPPVATLLAHTCTQVHRATQPTDAYTHWVEREGDTERRDEEKRREG